MFKTLFNKFEGKGISSHTSEEVRTLKAIRDAGPDGLQCVVNNSELQPPSTIDKDEFNTAIHEHQTHGFIKVKKHRITADGKTLRLTLSQMQHGDPGPPSTEVAIIKCEPKGNAELRFIESRWLRSRNQIVLGVVIGVVVMVLGAMIVNRLGQQPDDEAPVESVIDAKETK